MNIKSLLLGSAVAAVAATGARAADAIVIAEPEPMEYVRICDVYGAGFFYIPGTETCLRIGGYMRYEMHYSDADWISGFDPVTGDPIVEDYRFSKYARFQLNVDARNETEWGTLRSYVEGRFHWASQSWAGGFATGGYNEAYLNQGFIELQQANGTIRLGKTDTAYARFLGYGTPFGPFDGVYGFNNSGELSYQYNGANGFSAIVAVVERGTGLFEPAVEGGVKFTQGWGDIGAMVGYDTVVEEWGAKVVANAKFGMFDVGAHVYYSSGPSIYTIGGSEFSAVVYAKANVTQKLAVAAAVQYFDDEYLTSDESWQITGGLDWRPVSGLRIRPEVQYNKTEDAVFGDSDSWRTAIRFDRTF